MTTGFNESTQLAAPGHRATSIAILLAAFLVPRAAFAHDYWVIPHPLVVPADQEIAVSVLVGDDFVAEHERPFEAARTSRFTHLHGGKSTDLLPLAIEGGSPVLRFPVAGGGGHLFVLDRNVAKLEMLPAKFEDYLQHEGLAPITAERTRRGETALPGRERYTRCLKALVQVGETRNDSFATVTGQTLEIIPESNPVFVAPGETLAVRVQFRGAPLARVRIEAFSRDARQPPPPGEADIRGAPYTTDDRGIAEIPIDRRGIWLIRTLHMVRCDGCADADWESTWASYVFASRPLDGATVAAPPMPGLPKTKAEDDGQTRQLGIGVASAAVLVLLAALGAYFFRRRKQSRKHG